MYDVIFIGSGHAAWHGAATLALAGKKVAIVEEDLTGGTCTNYGCDAKITLDGPCLSKYLIDTGNDVILVDTGVPKGAPETIPETK